MRLLNLKLENWALHSHIDAPLAHSLQIEGRNGTGKSSILDAIRFIFSRDARNYKKKIKNGARSCTVELAFTKDGNEYLVEKRLYLNRPSTAKMLINSKIVASNPSEVYNRLGDVLSENVLDKLLYVPQDGLVELIENLRIKGGRQELDSLLDLDRFEKVYKGIRDELNVKEANLDLVSNQILKYPEDAEKVFNEQIEALKKEMLSLEKKSRTESETLAKLNSRTEKLEKEISRIQGVKKERDEIEKRMSEIRLDVAKGRKEAEFIQQRLSLVKDKREKCETLRLRIETIDRYPVIKDFLSRLMRAEEKLVDVGDIKEKSRELEGLGRELASKKDVEKRCKTMDAEVVDLERVSAARKQSLLEKEEYLKSLGDLVDKVKCPRCGQRLTREHIKTEKIIAENEVKSLGDTIEDLVKKLETHKTVFRGLNQKLERLQKIEFEFKCLKEEIEKKSRDREKIMSEIKDMRKKLSELNYGNESMQIVDSKVAELHNIKGEIKVLREEISKEEEYENGLKDINVKLSEISCEEKKAGERLKSLDFDENLLEALQHDKEDLLKQSYEIQNSVSRCELQIGHLKGVVGEVEDKREEFSDLRKQESGFKKDVRLLKDAGDIFHTNKGIVKYLRERYTLQLSEQMTYYFKRINQNPKYREIAFDRDYNIGIKTTEGSFSIDQLSGGERVQLAIALRIALIRLISPINLLILDEPFGSLDREHREVLGEALNKIASDGQLILVTHIMVDSLKLPGRLELGGYT